MSVFHVNCQLFLYMISSDDTANSEEMYGYEDYQGERYEDYN
jgi:hypothetical protein